MSSAAATTSRAMAAAADGPATIKELYRTFLRESQKQNAQKRSAALRRADPLPRYVRKLARAEITGQEARGSTVSPTEQILGTNTDALRQRLDNIATLLTQTRIHGELLARYNPVYGKSGQEHIKATANRVGLDLPKEYEDAARDAQRSEPGIDQKYR